MSIVLMHLRKMPLKYWGVVPSQSGPLWLQSVGHHGLGVYISIKFYSILIMKMNCLLTPPLPTVQPEYDDDDDGNGRRQQWCDDDGDDDDGDGVTGDGIRRRWLRR